MRFLLASVFLPSCSWTQKSRNDVHFPENPHDCKQSLALFWSSDSFLNAFSRILEVELAIAEMACVSRNVRRTLHVPSGVPVQRSISERSSQWFIDFLFITRDSRKSNKLCGRKTTKQKELTLWALFCLLSFCLVSCSWVRKSRDSSLSCFVRATLQVAYGKARTVT